MHSLVYSCPFLAERINPVIPIVGAVLYFFTMSSLLRTTFTDPGVIPRASNDEAAYIEKQIGEYYPQSSIPLRYVLMSTQKSECGQGRFAC